jgi:uncharacterized protein with PIN domain
MVLDSSAIIASELQEPGFERLIDEIGNAEALLIGIPNPAPRARRPSLASRFSPEHQSRSRYFHRRAPGRGH